MRSILRDISVRLSYVLVKFIFSSFIV